MLYYCNYFLVSFDDHEHSFKADEHSFKAERLALEEAGRLPTSYSFI